MFARCTNTKLNEKLKKYLMITFFGGHLSIPCKEENAMSPILNSKCKLIRRCFLIGYLSIERDKVLLRAIQLHHSSGGEKGRG